MKKMYNNPVTEEVEIFGEKPMMFDMSPGDPAGTGEGGDAPARVVVPGAI